MGLATTAAVVANKFRWVATTVPIVAMTVTIVATTGEWSAPRPRAW